MCVIRIRSFVFECFDSFVTVCATPITMNRSTDELEGIASAFGFAICNALGAVIVNSKCVDV